MSVPVYKNFIGGEWVESKSRELFQNLNPADAAEVIGRFADSGPEDVERAVAAAREAYRRWRLTPAPRRAEILFRLGELLIRRKEEFARDMTREMGKVLKETRGDVQEAIDMSFLMAGEGRRLLGHTTPSELPNKFQMCIREPLGVAGLITHWNFPMAIPSWKMMAALAAGNTVVLKPATDTPLSAVNLVKTCEEAGIPGGVVNLVTGGGSRVGTPLMKHPGVAVISFTGSTEVGRKVSEACAPDFRRCHLEMGGKNAIIVMDDADLDLAVDGTIWGGFGTTGQRCTAASRVIVHQRVYSTWVEKFVARARALRVGNGLEQSVEMGPAVNEGQLKTVMEYVQIGKAEGARLACGGERLTAGAYGKGWFHEPTVFSEVSPGMRIAQEEIFGPVVSVIRAASLEQAIEIANGVIYGLSGAIYTRDVNNAFQAMRDVYTGVFYVNASTIGAEVHLPFGGTKQTGNGHREAGIAGIDVFTEWKSIYVDFSGKLQRAQMD